MSAALQQRPQRAGRGGFTLLEMLLVIGLLSMLAGVLVAGSASLLKGTARSDPEDALLALMQTWRRQAVERGATSRSSRSSRSTTQTAKATAGTRTATRSTKNCYPPWKG